nr:hypothetical protein [Bradyrhizobium diazoefficiens]
MIDAGTSPGLRSGPMYSPLLQVLAPGAGHKFSFTQRPLRIS